MRKIRERKSIARKIAALKKKGKKTAFANGCFDIIHVGHVRFLEGAKAKADALVVGINSDSSVRKLKGKGRPLMNEKDRAEIISEFEFVDYVVIFGERTVDKTLKELKPDYHVKGTDYTKDTVPEKEMARGLGIKIAIAGDRKNHSTKDIIKEIVKKGR